MAEVTFLQHHDGEADDDNDLIDAFASVPCFQEDFNDDAFDPSYPFDGFDLQPDTALGLDLFDHRENQVNFVMDLFHQRVDQGSRSRDPNPARLELDLGVGFDDGCDDESFGFGFGVRVSEVDENEFLGMGLNVEDNDNDNDCGFGLGLGFDDGCDDGSFGFRVGVRVGGEDSEEDDDENEFLGVGLNVEDINDDDNNNGCDDDNSLQLCWDSLQLEDSNREGVEDFEWEEVDGRVDEREVLSLFDADEDMDVASVPSVMIPNQEGEEEEEMGGHNLEWEVLLNVHNFETQLELDAVENLDPLGDTAEYEMFFGHFAENENMMMGRPPASKTVIENLESVVVMKEDVENDNALCAVCKDGMSPGEEAKKLPCSHRYHGDCIVPWLGIRNTCPVCRFELPTDDPDYERRKRNQRADRGQ